MAVRPNSPYWDKRATARLTDTEKASEEYIARVRRAYDKGNRNIQKDISSIYSTYGKKTGLDRTTLETLLSKGETDKFWQTMEGKGLKEYVNKNYKSRITRLEKLQGELYEKSKRIALDEYNISTEGYRDTVNTGYHRTIYDTQQGTGMGFGFDSIDSRGIDAILDHNWSGKHYSDRIWKNTDILAESLSEILGGAVMSGQSKEKTAREIRELMGVSKYQAERLIRTETNYFNNQAEAEAYEEMDVEEYVYVSTLDSRTSNVCQDLDQKRYKLKDRKVGVNYPPMHPNCRSTIRAWLGEEYEPIRRRARDPETGKTSLVPNQPYHEWAKSNNVPLKVPKTEIPTPKKEKPKKNLDFRKDSKKITLTGIDKEYQPEVMSEFNKVYNKYPIDVSHLEIKTNRNQSTMGHAEIGFKGINSKDGFKVKRSEGIVLNRDVHKNQTTSEQTHQRVTDHFKKSYKGHEGTIWHEYAHQIDYQYSHIGNEDLVQWARDYDRTYPSREDIPKIKEYNGIYKKSHSGKRMSEQVYDRLFNVMGEGNDAYTESLFKKDIISAFGEYAGTEPAEMLAEGFATMNLTDPSTYSKMTKEFKKIFDEMYSEIGRTL